MKQYFKLLVLILTTTHVWAQTPQGMSYQAIVRDASNNLVSEQSVGIEIIILQGSTNGVAVYNETHTATTNTNGLVSLTVGTGATGDDFSAIDWAFGPYFIQTQIDPMGGSNYTITATSQLLSVPYALYAQKAGSTNQAPATLGIVLQENNSANSQQIKDLADPTEAQDAVTKNYTYSKEEVDNLIAVLQSQIDALTTEIPFDGVITDFDGNTYNYQTYGTQQWTLQNAAMETYRDGTLIPQVTNPAVWPSLTTGAWCYIDNDPTKGKLYNWYAVAGIHDNDPNTPNKHIAPEGWHVPSDTEWTTLQNFLIAIGYNYDGTTTDNKIAKAMAATSGWNASTNPGAPGNGPLGNNTSGFNIKPEGYRSPIDGSFIQQQNFALVWSATVNNNGTDIAFYRVVNYDTEALLRGQAGYYVAGYSIRFIKD
jgi:uncharacterized protein (TIGR02145 family)